jgi:hypothetical protein
MGIREIAKVLTVIFALTSIPPSILFVRIFALERKVLQTSKEKDLSGRLAFLFVVIAVMAIINAIVGLAGVLGYGAFAHNFSPIRSAFTGLAFTLSTWSLYLIQKRL